MKLFESFQHINWGRFIWVMSGIALIWAGLDFIIPPKIYLYVARIIPLISAAITYFMRPTVYVPRSGDQQ